MPKITVHGGASDATLPEPEAEAVDAPAPAPEAEAPVAEPVVEDGGEVVESSGGSFKPLPELTGDVELDSVELVAEPDYEAWTVEQLKDQLDTRGLSKTGKKDDLVLRLLEDDEAHAAEAE
ncbi:SAP domain-containing protein [Streptomyces lasiicapitis]|uniref:SAP domain-containing protein n=1 Tax=Streptomyces lasiicapitis TaxID=1923961 RepID=UPI00365E1871